MTDLVDAVGGRIATAPWLARASRKTGRSPRSVGVRLVADR